MEMSALIKINMKIFCVASLCILCSCSVKDNYVVQENTSSINNVDIIKTETDSIETVNEDVEERHSNTPTPLHSNTSLEEMAKIELDNMMNSLIQKDAEAWRQYVYRYIEGNKGYLYSVDFEDYEIIDFLVMEKNPIYNCSTAAFNVEIDVSESNDIRFLPGRSQWNIMLYGEDFNSCMYFLSDVYSSEGICSENSENEAARLGYAFSYSFNCFETINNISEYCFAIENESLHSGLRAFLYLMSNVTGEPLQTNKDSDSTISKYLGIDDHILNERITEMGGLGGDIWKTWDMKEVHAVITEQTDNYIDIVYFGDYVYLTPAKKTRYYFTKNNETIQLIGTELLEDYGYDPNWELN